jgi:hypothetical protein
MRQEMPERGRISGISRAHPLQHLPKEGGGKWVATLGGSPDERNQPMGDLGAVVLVASELDFIHSLDKKGKAEYSSLKLSDKKDERRWICQRKLYRC